MFFLLRVAFWLVIVLALLPSGGGSNGAKTNVDTAEAVAAAGAAVSDMSGFCDRQPGACEVGAHTAVAIGQRAQAGAKMVYDFISSQGDKPASPPASKVATARSSSDQQSTLKPDDLDPSWRGTIRGESVPLPRPRPRTESRTKA
jgi:hypothetical protein